VHLATDQPTFWSLLERADAGGSGFRIDLATEDPAAEAVARFAASVDALLSRKGGTGRQRSRP
jgi:hypothetical protein